MPKLVFRLGVGEVENYPDLPYKKRPSVRTGNRLEPIGLFDPNPWYDEQGFTEDQRAFIEQISVTEFEDGTLVAYLTKRETYIDERGRRRVKAYPGETPLTHTYVEHVPVTSIELLLDQFVRDEVAV